MLNLIKTNETLPDIEKLERSEFILDLEEHQKHQAEEAELIAKVIEVMQNTALKFSIRYE